jgi:hypothetical protein
MNTGLKIWMRPASVGKVNVFVAYNGIVVGKVTDTDNPDQALAKLAPVIFKYGK